MGSRSPNRVKIGARGVAPAGTTEVLIYVGCGTCNAGSQGIYDSIRFWRSARPNSGDLIFERSMVYGFGGLVSEERPEGPVYVQGDQVGSPNILTNASGAVVGRSKNLPFGERFGSVGYRSNRRYTNHEETEDYAIYMQARTYLPAYGKFAQVDPAYDQTKDDPESWNLYNYVTNNPVTHTDPDGRETEKKEEKKDTPGQEGGEKDGEKKEENKDGQQENNNDEQTNQTGEAEAKNALTAEEKKQQTGPKIVNLTGDDMYKDQSGSTNPRVQDNIIYYQASVVTSTDATFKKDATSAGSVKIVVFHSYQQTVELPFTHVLYFQRGDRSKPTLLESPIHISGSRVYVVGCGMDRKSSFGMFTFDKGAKVRGINAAGGVGEGLIRALQWEGGKKPDWGGLVWRP